MALYYKLTAKLKDDQGEKDCIIYFQAGMPEDTKPLHHTLQVPGVLEVKIEHMELSKISDEVIQARVSQQ